MSSIVTRPAASAIGRRTLGGTGLEQLRHAGQTLRDVVGRCRTTGVEGTHRQLGAGLTDRLGRDDADGLADVDELAGGERTAVALRTHTDGRLAGQDRAHLDGLDTRGDQLVDQDVSDVGAGLGDDLALGVDRVGRQGAGVDGVLDRRVADQVPSASGAAIGMSRPRDVPQSSSRMMTSCETSTRRRVR